MSIASILLAVVDIYAITMTAQVPRIYNNTESLGSRRYCREVIKGTMTIDYGAAEPVVAITGLTNTTERVAGAPVTYACDVSDTRVNLVGSNATGRFRTASLSLFLDAEPSYVAGYEPTDDNALLVALSAKGSAGTKGITSMSGTFAGTLGCGCSDYGHVSPTRVAGPCGPSTTVTDVAAVYGTWRAVRKRRLLP